MTKWGLFSECKIRLIFENHSKEFPTLTEKNGGEKYGHINICKRSIF